MKKIVLFLFGAVFLVSCSNNPKGDKAQTTGEVMNATSAEGTSYQVDPSASSITWTGSKVTGSHTGTVAIESGNIIVNNKQLAGGNFSVDMQSINNEDLRNDAENKAKLESHLKSDDFFAVGTYPKASFEITEVKNATEKGADVSGNLTLRGVTNNITFPVTITSHTEGAISVTADFNINRKDWGVKYEGMQDDLIADEINLKIALQANK